MPSSVDHDVVATLVVADLHSTLSGNLHLRQGQQHREATAAIRQAFCSAPALSERPLSLQHTDDDPPFPWPSGIEPCRAVTAKLEKEEVETDHTCENSDVALALAVKVTAPLRLATSDATPRRKPRHIKTDVFLNGDLIESNSRPCRLPVRPGVTDTDIEIFSGLRIHRQIEMPFIYRNNVAQPHEDLVINQWQRWTSVAASLLERAQEISGSAQEQIPVSAQYLAALAEVDLPKDLESASNSSAIIDIVMTAGHGRRQNASSTYIKQPTLLKDPRYHELRDLDTPMKTQGLVDWSGDSTPVHGTSPYYTTAALEKSPLMRPALWSAQTHTVLPASTLLYGMPSPSELHSNAGQQSSSLQNAEEVPTHPVLQPIVGLSSSNMDPVRSSYFAMPLQPAPIFESENVPMCTAQPSLGTEPFQEQLMNPPTPISYPDTPMPMPEFDVFDPTSGDTSAELFGLMIQDGHNTVGTPVQQMVATSPNGKIYKLTPVKYPPICSSQNQTVHERRSPSVGHISLTNNYNTEHSKHLEDLEQIESVPALENASEASVTANTSHDQLDTPQTSRQKKEAAEFDDAQDNAEEMSTGRQKRRRQQSEAMEEPDIGPRKTPRRTPSPLKQSFFDDWGSPTKPGSNRTAQRWDPLEDTVEEALEKFELPLLSRDSVVSYAGAHAARQISKARPGEFIEDEFIVGMRFVVL